MREEHGYLIRERADWRSGDRFRYMSAVWVELVTDTTDGPKVIQEGDVSRTPFLACVADLRDDNERNPLYLMWLPDQTPYIGYFVNGERHRWRDATPADREAVNIGRLKHDGQTDPTTKAWAKHVAEGGN